MTCSHCTHPLYAAIRCGGCGRWTDEKEEKMNRDDINRLWNQAYVNGMLPFEQIERFAALVAAAEREACAKLCIEIEQSQPLSNRIGWEHGTVDCAAAIRARKE